MNIRTVSVLGANGSMGCKISGIFASFGNAKVYMICRDKEMAEKAKAKAALSVKADSILSNLYPKTYEDLKECILKSDLVYESVSEDMNIKKDIYMRISPYLQSDTVIASGTSGISINELSKYINENHRSKFLGIHMYNPPYNLTLCEVIPSQHTDKKLLAEMKEYLKSKLIRKVVEVKDEPAFMGNRIGFQFINEVLLYAEKNKDVGGIDYIDEIFGPFTGRVMAPLATSDFVGLDVHKAIVDNIRMNTNDYANDTFIMPDFALKLIANNMLGRKTGCGLYKSIYINDGSKQLRVYDIDSECYREVNKYNFPFARKMINDLKYGNYSDAMDKLALDDSVEANICMQLLIKYVLYAIFTAKSIGEDIHSADDVIANGYNWIPPLALIDSFGGSDKFLSLARRKLSNSFQKKTDIEKILHNVPYSKYDYRPFLKAK